MVDGNSMVVVVDTNRPKMTECEELLGRTKTIVVLDHHRPVSYTHLDVYKRQLSVQMD